MRAGANVDGTGEETMSFTEYVIACERLVFDMKTFNWFIIKDLIKPYKQCVTPEAFVKSFYK